MKKIVWLFLLVLCLVGCTKSIEVRTDSEPLEDYLPDMTIESCAWYSGTVKDIFSGVGPSRYFIIGVAKVEEDSLNAIKEAYTWVEDDSLLSETKELDLSAFIEDESTLSSSEQYNADRTNPFTFRACFDFENHGVVFYTEFMLH